MLWFIPTPATSVGDALTIEPMTDGNDDVSSIKRFLIRNVGVRVGAKLSAEELKLVKRGI